MGKKILYCASTASHIMNFHLPYLEYFKEQGWQVDVAVPSPVGIPYADRLIDVPFQKSLLAINNFNTIRLTKQLLKENQYDIISTHTTLAGAIVRLAVKLVGKKCCGKVIHTSHGYFFNTKNNLQGRVYLWVEKCLATITDVLMVMNESDYQLAVQHKLGKKIAHIFGMGVDLSKFHRASNEEKKKLKLAAGYQENDFLVVYAGEMSKRKNQGELIKAFALVSTQEPCFQLVLAGDGALRREYEGLAQSLGIGNLVHFHGHVSDIASLYRMCDIAVSTSRSEGLPFNVMEAMATGLPVIASSVKGHIDLLKDNPSTLYELYDEKKLAELLLVMYKDKNLREKIGESNSIEVQKYELEKVKPFVVEWY